MKTRIAKVTHYYAGRTRMVGKPYEIEDAHVQIMLMAGRIEPEIGDPGYQGRAMESDQTRHYKKRDIKRNAHKAA